MSSSNPFSSFLRNIHQMAPAESHACERTEWTICAVSKPKDAKVLSKYLSVGVENMTGVFAVNKVTKSKSRAEGIGKGVGVLSRVGEPESERMEETERRLVRAGVRTA